MELINEVAGRFAEDKDFKLLVRVHQTYFENVAPDPSVKIVDSIMALFRVDFSGRGELSERQQRVRLISPLCCECNTEPSP